MQVILLESIKSLGEFGEEVKVRPGYARNYLLPQGKALFASEQARADFVERRQEYLERSNQAQQKLQAVAEALEGLEIEIAARTVDGIKLYGSVAESEIVAALAAKQISVKASEIKLEDGHIRSTGSYQIPINLGDDITATVSLHITDIQQDNG